MPPITLGLSLQRSRSVSRPVVLHVQFSHSFLGVVDRAGDVPAFVRWLQTDQYCNPIPGSTLWVLVLVTRSLLSSGRWFRTHCRYPQSALDRWCLWLLGRSVVKPKLLDAGLSLGIQILAPRYAVAPKGRMKVVISRQFPWTDFAIL